MAPRISIIVTAYSEKSKPYLDACIRSIKNLNYPKDRIETIVVGHPKFLPQYEGVRTIAPDLEQFYPPVGLNFGINAADPMSEFMLILNDDTILTKNCLNELLAASMSLPQIGLIMPISNDQQHRYVASVGVPPGPHTLEAFEPNMAAIMNYESPYPPALTFHETLCIYAFMISRKTIAKVGLFDESLIGQDDIDYTYRVSQAGLLNAIAFSSVIYHFGGVTSKHTFSAEAREKSFEVFNKKWMPK